MVFDIRARAAQSGRGLAAEAEDWARSAVAGGTRLMGFGHRVYKVRDPRADVLAKAAAALFADAEDRRLYDDARVVEHALLHVLHELKPGRHLETNVEFWAAVILDFADVPAKMMPAMFTCGRTAGWCAHILEQKQLGKLVRPSAVYVGPEPRAPEDVEGWSTIANAAH